MHLGQRVDEAPETQGSPPGGDDWPAHANLPLTYHPVPDIA